MDMTTVWFAIYKSPRLVKSQDYSRWDTLTAKRKKLMINLNKLGNLLLV